jgi:hypothetical protein
MNLEYKTDVDEIGAVTNADGTIIISYKNGDEYGVYTTDTENKAIGTYESLDLKSPVKKSVEITNWKTLELFLEPLPSGASIQCYYKLDKTGDWLLAKTASGSNSFTTANQRKAVFALGANADVFEFRLILTPTGNEDIEIHKVEIFFD